MSPFWCQIIFSGNKLQLSFSHCHLKSKLGQRSIVVAVLILSWSYLNMRLLSQLFFVFNKLNYFLPLKNFFKSIFFTSICISFLFNWKFCSIQLDHESNWIWIFKWNLGFSFFGIRIQFKLHAMSFNILIWMELNSPQNQFSFFH